MQYRYLGCYRQDKIFRIIIVLLDPHNNILQYEHVTRVNICPFVRLPSVYVYSSSKIIYNT